MKKRVLLAMLTCAALTYTSGSAGMPAPSPITGLLSSFEYTVPNEWLERDSHFSITAPSSDVDSDFSLIQGEEDHDIRYVPIPDSELDNNNGQTIVPISPENNDYERDIISIIPLR